MSIGSSFSSTTRNNKLTCKIGLWLPIMVFVWCTTQPKLAAAEELEPASGISAAINNIIQSKQNALLAKSDFSKHAEQLTALYALNNNQLLWLDNTASEANIQQALNILANAGEDALEPRDYDADVLKMNMPLAMSLPATAATELAKFDTALSIALLRFSNDLHHGRVDPSRLNYPRPFGSKASSNAPQLIKQALEQNALALLPAQLQPQLKQYQQLKQILAQYKQTPAEANFEPLRFTKALRPGNHHPQLAELRRRLIALGSLPEQTNDDVTDKTYNSELQQAVKTFQRENGLGADGIIGSETAARLNQSKAQKILQIELAMERLRWLPDNIKGPMIIVNIPAFQLWAFNSIDDADMLSMKVIVGKAFKNQTPVLFEDMKYLEFMPYWNIPKSIMDKEILPKLYNDFGYLQSQDIELVNRYSSGSGSWDSLFDDIRSGRVRARQRPGNKNPLGKVKFIFPNQEDVYLHDTSTHSLFNRNQRDLSHGCVRVAEADKLAEFVLSQQPDSQWDVAAIQEAMSGKKTRRVNLQKPIPVLFYYATSFVDQNNQIHFYHDIYDQDAVLEKALGKIPSTENNSMLTAKTSSPS